MNILAVFFHFPPISGGGVIVAVDIVNTLAKKGHNVTVLTPDLVWSGPDYNPKIESNVKIIKEKTPSNNNLKIAARRCKKPLLIKGKELGNKINFDFIITIFHPFHMAPNAAVSIAKKLKIPVIVKIDDAVYEKSRGIKNIQRKIERMLSAKTLKKSSKILVSNEETKKIVTHFYNILPEKISIVPNGIQTKLFHSNIEKKSKIVIFSGVMYYHRGLDILIQSIPIVVKKIPDVKFIFLGEGPELENLKKFVEEKNIEKFVEFKGWINREEIINYLANASIGIGPLRSTIVTKNALPIKILEYMASSLPIICQKETLPNDVLINEKNGYAINSIDELAEKIIFLLSNDERRISMGNESYKIAQKFDWNKIIDKILEEFEKINIKS